MMRKFLKIDAMEFEDICPEGKEEFSFKDLCNWMGLTQMDQKLEELEFVRHPRFYFGRFFAHFLHIYLAIPHALCDITILYLVPRPIGCFLRFWGVFFGMLINARDPMVCAQKY